MKNNRLFSKKCVASSKGGKESWAEMEESLKSGVNTRASSLPDQPTASLVPFLSWLPKNSLTRAPNRCSYYCFSSNDKSY